GILRRNDRGLLRRQRLLSIQPGRAEGSRAGNLLSARGHLGVATEMNPMRTTAPFLLSSLLLTPSVRAAEPNPTLQQQLIKEDVGALAKAAREQGDVSRGAIVFYRPDLACTRCHFAGEDAVRRGPDLARAGKEAT